MSYYVRLMCKEDVAHVTEIDHEAFPTQWPSPNYENELRNRLAHYIVVCDERKIVEKPEVEPPSGKSLLPSRLRRLFGRNPSFSDELPSPIGHYIIGFSGFWIMADEAHISNIVVREVYRRQGLGELLLIHIIDMAIGLKARIVTLEVRVSNTVAQNLYSKYSFTQVGIRRGYYVDRGYQLNDREDGFVMTTPDMSSAEFQAHLEQLKQAHYKKGGIALNQITGNYRVQPDNL